MSVLELVSYYIIEEMYDIVCGGKGRERERQRSGGESESIKLSSTCSENFLFVKEPWLLGAVTTMYVWLDIVLLSSCSGCEAFSKSCQKALEPEDVTVGLVIGK